MSNIKLKLSILLTVFAVLTMISNPAMSETMDTYTTDNLYFELGNDESFIDGTSDGKFRRR